MEHLGSKELSGVKELRYRGHGWPGLMTVVNTKSNGEVNSASVSYAKGWGEILQKKRQWRCHVCADHTGELADISVGDPWYRSIEPGEVGSSLLVVRTKRGQRILQEAIKKGYVVVERRSLSTLQGSQENLLRARGSIWGRLWALKLMGVAYPRYPGLKLFSIWLRHLGWREKLQCFYGTALRVFKKKLYQAECWEHFSINADTNKRL